MEVLKERVSMKERVCNSNRNISQRKCIAVISILLLFFVGLILQNKDAEAKTN